MRWWRKYFVTQRLQAIWYLLTKPMFVSITANANNDRLDIQLRYNLKYDGFVALSKVISPLYEQQDAEAGIMKEVNDVLSKSHE